MSFRQRNPKNLADDVDHVRDDRDIILFEEDVPQVTMSTDLLQMRSKESEIQPHSTSREDLLHSVPALRTVNSDTFREPCNDYRVILNTALFGTDIVEDLNSRTESERLSQTNSKDVSWNDMFDTELLPAAPAFIDRSCAPGEQGVSVNHTHFAIHFPLDKSKTNKCDIIEKKVHKRMKHENNADAMPKKKKAAEDKKPTLRKEKYTKTVKRWLDEVDSNNPVENKIMLPEGEQTTCRKTHIEVTKAKGSKSKPSKKVIQAQLANKGGKMKFDKPQSVQNNICIENTTTPDDIPGECDNKVGRQDNIKKNKPKFLPPIKSQIPVKDITFEIHVIGDSNFEEHLAKLPIQINQGVYSVLIFR